MSWVKLDDGFAMHPKVIALSLEARWAYIEALCYSARYETDGIVPDQVAANGPVRQELLVAGLWENGPASIGIHDYLAYNPSRGEQQAKRNAGRNAARTRWDGESALPPAGDGEVVLDVGLALKSKESSFDVFWATYPRPVGKPKARIAFDKYVSLGADPADIVAGAARFRDDPNREDEFTPHPTTWLNREGWNDPALPPRGGRRSSVAAELAQEALDLERRGL